MAIINDDSADHIHASDPQAELECSPSESIIRRLGSSGEVLKRVDLDLAYSSEKLLNLKILLMHVEARASDYEALVIESEDVSADSIEKALEFDILSGILDSEVKELDNFMISLQEEIMDARDKISLCENFKETSTEVEGNLHDSEESLKQLQQQVSGMRMLSAKFQSTISFGGEDYWNSGVAEFPEISQFSSVNTKVKMQTTEQQRHILKMLEKSLARELDLEKWLSESSHNEEELKVKLHCAEETVDLVSERLFESENTAEILMGISKELMGKLQIVQLNLNGSMQREESALRKLMEIDNSKPSLKEAEDRYSVAGSEAGSFRYRLASLEGQPMESDVRSRDGRVSVESSLELWSTLESQICGFENTIADLRAKLSEEKMRVEIAEAKRLELTELMSLQRSNLMEKVNLLEKQLRQTETKLQHAKASDEASQERQNMLASAFSDMEKLIEDLKAKASKAESRAESAEAKCIQLTETNLEVNKEVGFLRGRIECLEVSLHEADNVKITTAKDIGVRTKVITDLVMQLAMERERLQTQISSLMKENSLLVEKLQKNNKAASIILSSKGKENGKESILFKNDWAAAQCLRSLEEVTESSTTTSQVDKFAKDAPPHVTEVGPTISTVDTPGLGSKQETVRTIEVRQLNSKYVFIALLVVLVSVLAVYLFQQETWPI
ncbi:WPP domain-interacting tail-anchored protein 1-like isoform X2 [Magnolia sinica]|nr:WPP domain-interacting tail-anchored protein 1-like isoform X2 [Magnolia sinica]